MKIPNDTAPEALARLQYEFAAHIRDPQSRAAPDGIEDRRMAIYRDLFFNNIKSFLSGNFPVLRSVHNDDAWETLCRDFYRDYRCHTPLFPELPREFLKYLQDTRQRQETDPPFMLELAHYEWVELGLSLDESEPGAIPADKEGDLLSGVPILSPVAWPLSYNYPVHQIREDFQPQEIPEEATHLLVWRRHDFEIRFMQLNVIALLLLEKMKEDPDKTGLELLTDIAVSLNHPKPEVVIDGGATLLNEFRDKEIVLGTRP